MPVGSFLRKKHALLGMALETKKSKTLDDVHLVKCFVCIVLDVSRKELLEEIEDLYQVNEERTAQQIKIANKKTWRRLKGCALSTLIIIGVIIFILYQWLVPGSMFQYWLCRQGSIPDHHLYYTYVDTNNGRYDIYNLTKEVLKDFHSGQEDKLQHRLICQGSFFSNVAKFSFSQLNTLWSAAQSKLPKNIFNFTVRYINNSLPTRKNLTRWGLASSRECYFCLCPETLLHVVAGCQSYLQRFTWRHDSILNFLAETFQTTNPCQLYADLSGHKSPSIITGDLYRPDLLLITPNEDLYVLELTVGFESNLHNNVKRKKAKYKDLIEDQRGHFNSVKFVNLSMSSL
ncbi:Hypothetical predicted protein, partial [Paramuricea clavata]